MLKTNIEKLSSYLTAIVIALAGVGFFVFAIWYIAYFPVPYPIQPLQRRIILILKLEKIKEMNNDFILLESDNGDIDVYEEPNENSQ